MTKTGIRRLLLLSGTTALASFGAAGTANAQAAAGTTLAGTQITNKANASYTVNGTAATAESNIASFVVDRKVNLSVVGEPNINTQVNLGQTNAVLTFRVTNNTNSIQDMLLRANQNLGAGGTGVDNYDVNNVRVFVDSNGNGQYDANVDVGTYIDELGIDQSAIVFIVADVPSNVPTANFATVSLNATVAAGGGVNVEGAALIPATDLNLLTQNADLDVVFADNDSDGVLGADAARNGQARAYLEYEVGARAVNLTVSKSSMVISDGVNLINPRSIPGAVVQYCLTVTNSTLLTPASGINLTDVIPANTTYEPNSITVGGLGAGNTCVLNGFPVNDDGTQVLLSPYGGSYNAGTKTVTAIIPTLLGGTAVQASFRVRIN